MVNGVVDSRSPLTDVGYMAMHAFVNEGGIEDWYGGHFAQGSVGTGIGIYALFKALSTDPVVVEPHRVMEYLPSGNLDIIYICIELN